MQIAFSLLILFYILLSCGNQKSKRVEEISLESGLKYEILKVGSGEAVKKGDEVIIQESMTYLDGTELYSTKGLENLPKFLIGGNQVIEGLDKGVRGMQLGEIRKLIVPHSLSARKQYSKFLSPDSTLVYEIEIMEIIEPIKKDIGNRAIRPDSLKSGFELVFVKGESYIMGGDDHVDDGAPLK